jgi:hypothetical protein
MNSAVELPCCKGVRPGTNLRVHVVGEETFATLVHSKATDYRYGLRDDLEAADLEAFELTDELAQRCVSLAVALNLPLPASTSSSALSGEATCFEVNPSPAFDYDESGSGQPIARALARYLLGG